MALPQDQIRALDSLRQRLSALSNSLQGARVALERADPVPKWDDLQSAAQLIALNIDQTNQILNANRLFFTQAHAYPLPSFPGQREEALLALLLRKRLDPKAETWIEEYSKEPERGNDAQGKRKGMSRGEMRELWSWAGPASNAIVRGMLDEGQFDEDFTLEEQDQGVGKVVTGLRRDLACKDDDDHDDDVDEQQGSGEKMDDRMPDRRDDLLAEAGENLALPAVPLETVLRFMSIGVLPSTDPYPGDLKYK